ncbi:amino acid/polyamine/organocation transporter, APC superfamily [Granulicella pectinivorans]|jgi:APA family basic amino acid/polyamine antiporter|uniref:Amino acid/polyamine/organocation transporter, APC superfamily n=1 Tax=Granulicella pectinivorans TaxID=474950 RepID=A0A1I6MMU9_9BACT|nr:amino acid permease [Granulicella pectinivorans]SFS17009.1 amino acid/polyamine/organocation transporter, APC superfamily [Granulicella pectinivorans]
MPTIFAKKSMEALMEESHEHGSHSLERSLGPFALTALGIGAVIGAGIFVLSGLGAQTAGPALMLAFVLSGLGCAFAGLCYAEFAAMIPLAGSAYTYAYATLGELFAWIIGWDLTLEYAMGASTVSSGWSNTFVEFLAIFHLKFPLWLAYDHWTGLKKAYEIVARQELMAAHPDFVSGTKVFSDALSALMSHPSPALTAAAHALLNAPKIGGVEIGFNLPAFLIALVITAVLVIGIKESANFNAGIVVLKVAVVLFVLGLGSHYVNRANWGQDWHTFAPFGVGGIGLAAGLVFFSYIGFDAVSTTAQEAKNPQRDMPIGMILSLAICTLLYIGVAAVLTGMVYWPQVNVEAPIVRAFLDRGLNTAANVVTIGSLAGLTSVMLVMLLGQSRVLYSMAKDGLLPRGFFGDVHPRFRTPWKGTILAGMLAAVVGSVTPIDDIGKMVNIGTLFAFVIVCISVIVLRRKDPNRHRPFRTPFVPAIPILGILFNGYMMYELGRANWIRLIVWLLIGLCVYFGYSRKHSRVQQGLTKSFE